MYSDEYIQSIYNTATANKITATTRQVQVSIAEESLVDDDEEEQPSVSSSQRSSQSSFHRPVPPAVINRSLRWSSVLPQQQPPRPTTKIQPLSAMMMKQPPPPPALKKTTTAASNTTMTTTHTASTSNSSSTPPRFPPSAAAAAIDDDEPLPAATGPFAVPVHSKSKPNNNSNRLPPAARGGDSSGGGWISAQTTMLTVFWNRVFRRYYAMKLFGMLLAIYTAVLSFTYSGTFGKYGGVIDPETGYIIDTTSETNTDNGVIEMKGVKRAVVAATSFELVALVIARLTAFYMYPGTIYHLYSVHSCLLTNVYNT
jgi:hypothetical protein